MIGDGYFQLRAQIGTSLYSLTSLARELAAPESTLDSLQTLLARLREPFLFVTIGERGTGKSSLLNALFGRDFARDPALAGRAVTYRYGVAPLEEERTDGSLEVQRPSIFLRDFTLVEIPGFTPSEMLTRQLAAADLILIVLPAKTDLETSWTTLAQLDREILRRCVFVLQQSETVAAPDLPLIVERLRHHTLTALGHAHPIFPVSAHTRHGLEKLDRHIESEVVVSAERCQSLREICNRGREILAALGAHSQATLRAAEKRQKQIEEEQIALGARRDQSLRHAADALWSLTRLFDSAQSRATKLLQRKLTLTGIWTDKAGWWREFHAEMEARLRDSITRNLAAAFEKFEADLRDAWTRHRDILRKLRIEPCPPFSHDAPALFARLTADLAACDHDGVTTRAVQRLCAQARSRMRLPALLALASLAMLGGALFTTQYVLAAAVFTVVVAVGLLVTLGMVRGNVLQGFRGLMESRRERVLSYFEEEIRAEIERFYRALAMSLQPVKETGALETTASGPPLDRLHQLDELLERYAADIAARRTPTPAAADVT